MSKPKRDSSGAYPLHLAAANPNCPGSVIKLLVMKDSTILEKACVKRLPLHHYIARGKYDIGIIEYLVKLYPDSLTYVERNDYTPLGLLCQRQRSI